MKIIKNIFIKEFYERILNKSIKEAGPKYTPGLEKDAPNLEIKELIFTFNILGRTKEFYKYLRYLSDELEKQSDLNYSVIKISDIKIDISEECLKGLCKDIETLKNLIKTTSENYDVKNDIDFMNINQVSHKCLETISSIDTVLYKTRDAESKDKNKTETINHLVYKFRKLGEIVHEVEGFCNRPDIKLVNNPFLLLLGEAGIGKTHFLCDIARKRIADGYPSIILLGHHFQEFVEPDIQIMKILELNLSFERLLKRLNYHAIKNEKRCLIVIDAINEGNKETWKKTLNSFIEQIQPFKGVGLVVSCRTPFEKITIPKRPKPNMVVLFHLGFRDIELDAHATFFKYYKIPTPEVPLLIPEFSHPLFLKLFCKSLEDATVKKKHKQIKDIASGQKGMTYIFESFVKERGKNIENTFHLQRGYCWNNIFKKIAEKMANDGREWIPKKELKSFLSIKKATILINKLISEGMLCDTLEWIQGQKGHIEAIRFPYQKFSDHIIARYLLSRFLDTSTEQTIKNALAKESTLGSLFRKDKDIYARLGIIEALMIEFPTRIKNKGEMLDFIELNDVTTSTLVEAFINGLIWRDPASINDSTNKWVNRFLCHNHFKNRMMDILVALSTKPRHPYNATKLNRFLKNMKVNKRDLFWSEFLRKQDYHNSIYRIISWAEMTRAQTITKEYAQMYITILMWVLTSTNHSLRDKATRAIYYIGCKFPEILFRLTTESLEINDPYVPERMLASSYGVAMALQHEQNFSVGILQDYTRNLFDLMFKEDALYSTTHILARDYAKHTINISLLHNSNLLTEDEKKRIAPPFNGGIRKWGKSEDKNKNEYRDGNYPFGFAFDNYTIGYLIPKRNNYDFNDPEYIKVKSNMWWRIYQLGYSLENFGEIDKEIAQYDRYGCEANNRKVDRYGKKYCWIAWYEIAGFRQDRGLLKRAWTTDERERFRVDIDPSFPDEIQNIEIIKTDYLGNRKIALPDWIVKGPTPNISPYLILDNIQDDKGPWVLLDGYIGQEDLKAKRHIFIFPRGLLVKKNDFTDVVEHLKRQDLGDRWLPEIPEHHHTFAGEVPWCETFPDYGGTELPFIVGKKKKRVPFEEIEFLKKGRKLNSDEFKELSKVIGDYQDKKIPEEDTNNFFIKNEIQMRRIKRFRIEIEEKTKSYECIIPINILIWSSNESTANPGISTYVLSREICEVLGLTYRTQVFGLHDKSNTRASITLKWGEFWHTFHKLIYMRKDLLDRVLQDKGLELVWAVWGERGYKAKENAGLDEYVKNHQANKVFQKIITYKDKKGRSIFI